MVLHTCWDPTRLVIMTVGDGSLVFEAIRLRLPVLIIVRNLTVKKYVLRNLQERLTKCVCDPDDERFYRRFVSDETEEHKEGGEDVVVLAQDKDAGAGADADGQGGAVGNGGDEGQDQEEEEEKEDGESSSGND